VTIRLQFLGAATTVTGSQYLLTTDRARILVDCGMFQGSPNESIRNRIPLAYDPKTIDAILLTHAHLDHCGLIPHVVAEGFAGPIWATNGTVELAALVLLDSGKLQEEFAKRDARWERRHPDKAEAEDREDEAKLEAAIELADQGAALTIPDGPAGPYVVPPTGSAVSGEHVATSVEPTTSVPEAAPAAAAPTPASDPEHALRTQPPHLDIDLDEALYDEADARASLASFRGIQYDTEFDVAPGMRATFVDAGPGPP
jgi:Cft2 family RNA processing exonuclease